MKLSELIEKLRDFDPETPVVVFTEDEDENAPMSPMPVFTVADVCGSRVDVHRGDDGEPTLHVDVDSGMFVVAIETTVVDNAKDVFGFEPGV